MTASSYPDPKQKPRAGMVAPLPSTTNKQTSHKTDPNPNKLVSDVVGMRRTSMSVITSMATPKRASEDTRLKKTNELKYNRLKRQSDAMAANVLPPMPPAVIEVGTRRGSVFRGPPEPSNERRESQLEMLKMFKKLGVGHKIDVSRIRGREDEA